VRERILAEARGDPLALLARVQLPAWRLRKAPSPAGLSHRAAARSGLARPRGTARLPRRGLPRRI